MVNHLQQATPFHPGKLLYALLRVIEEFRLPHIHIPHPILGQDVSGDIYVNGGKEALEVRQALLHRWAVGHTTPLLHLVPRPPHHRGQAGINRHPPTPAVEGGVGLGDNRRALHVLPQPANGLLVPPQSGLPTVVLVNRLLHKGGAVQCQGENAEAVGQARTGAQHGIDQSACQQEEEASCPRHTPPGHTPFARAHEPLGTRLGRAPRQSGHQVRRRSVDGVSPQPREHLPQGERRGQRQQHPSVDVELEHRVHPVNIAPQTQEIHPDADGEGHSRQQQGEKGLPVPPFPRPPPCPCSQYPQPHQQGNRRIPLGHQAQKHTCQRPHCQHPPHPPTTQERSPHNRKPFPHQPGSQREEEETVNSQVMSQHSLGNGRLNPRYGRGKAHMEGQEKQDAPHHQPQTHHPPCPRGRPPRPRECKSGSPYPCPAGMHTRIHPIAGNAVRSTAPPDALPQATRQGTRRHHQDAEGGEVPRVGGVERPHTQSGCRYQSGGRKPIPPKRLLHQAEGTAYHHQGQRYGQQMGVQVCKKEGEERELGDFKARRVGRHQSGGAPKIKGGEGAPVQGCPRSLEELHRPVQVAHQKGEDRPGATHRQPPPLQPPPASAQGIGDAEGVPHRQGVESGHRQVIGDRRRDGRQTHQGGHQSLTKVVVVHRPARKPRVVGREPSGLDHRVHVSQVHGLFPATVGVPQVGVGHAQKHKSPKGPQEKGLLQCQQSPPLSQKPTPFPSPSPRQDAPSYHQRPYKEGHASPPKGKQLRAGEKPRQVGRPQQAQGAPDQPAPIGQGAEGPEPP
ncbi:hypothetical protein HRbin23_00755 [bacterium HR23]|nr:hypothetical protein HRbin23_00755 [bacterium HR23]